MEKIHIGYVQGIHGLRGDLKIKTKFENPDKIFQKGNKIFLNDEEHIITSCKFYKGYYLVTIDNIKHINLVEQYKGYDVYFDRSNLNLKNGEYILNDLFEMTIVCNNKEMGKVKNILDNNVYKILVVDYKKNYMIPLVEKYIEKVDIANKKIYCKEIEGLIL